MVEIYDPTQILQQSIINDVRKINDTWQLKQIQRFIANIQKED